MLRVRHQHNNRHLILPPQIPTVNDGSARKGRKVRRKDAEKKVKRDKKKSPPQFKTLMTPDPIPHALPQAHGFELSPLIGFFPRVSEEDHGSTSLFEGGTMDVDGP